MLISFDRSRTKNGQIWSANTVNRYRSAVQQFLTQFPGVRFYTPFNEPNLEGNTLTENHPGTAGKMFAALNELCRTRSCSVGAGDFSDVLSANKLKGFTSDYLNTYYEYVGRRKPTFWAVHSYQTVFREIYGRLQRFLDWSPVKRTGAVWITEVGVYKHRRTGTTYADSIGADKLRAFFNSSTYQDNLKRIKRFFYYEWHGDGPKTEDTGLVANNVIPGGTQREVYCVFFAKTRPGATCPSA